MTHFHTLRNTPLHDAGGKKRAAEEEEGESEEDEEDDEVDSDGIMTHPRVTPFFS